MIPYVKWAVAGVAAAAVGCSGAQTMTAALAELPVLAETPDRGVLVDLVKAIDRIENTQTRIVILPFRRALKSVENGQADFQMPLVQPLAGGQARRLYHGISAAAFDVQFFLYTRADVTIAPDELKQHSVATLQAHAPLFPFPVSENDCLECSLRMLLAHRVDAFIFAAPETNDAIERLQLGGMFHRELYRVYHATAVVPVGERGDATETLLDDALAKLHRSGELDRILAPLHDTNIDISMFLDQ